MGTTAYAARVGSGYAYPTAVHERAAQAITEFLASRGETDAVLLVNSCARGKATVDSSRLATSSFTPRLFSSAASASSAYAQRDDEALRRERLQAARWFVLDNNLVRIPWFLDRDLYFRLSTASTGRSKARCSRGSGRPAHARRRKRRVQPFDGPT